MHHFKQAISALILGVSSLATVSFASDPVPDEALSIKSAKSAGRGCFLKAKLSTISGDNRTLRLIFTEDFTVELGAAYPAGSRSNCQMALDMIVPIGWQYTLASFRYPTFLDIEGGGAVPPCSVVSDSAVWPQSLLLSGKMVLGPVPIFTLASSRLLRPPFLNSGRPVARRVPSRSTQGSC